MPDDDPITMDAIFDWFGSPLPREIVDLLWSAHDKTSVGEIRAEVRRLARARGTLRDNVGFY